MCIGGANMEKDKSKYAIEKQRVNIYMPKYMVEELDYYAEEYGANRTAMINVIVRQYLDQRAVVKMTNYAQMQDVKILKDSSND